MYFEIGQQRFEGTYAELKTQLDYFHENPTAAQIFDPDWDYSPETHHLSTNRGLLKIDELNINHLRNILILFLSEETDAPKESVKSHDNSTLIDQAQQFDDAHIQAIAQRLKELT